MTLKANPFLILVVGVLTVIVGMALIFANIAFGKAVVIVGAVGLALAWVSRRGPPA